MSLSLRKPVRIYRLDHTYHTMLVGALDSSMDVLVRFMVRGGALLCWFGPRERCIGLHGMGLICFLALPLLRPAPRFCSTPPMPASARARAQPWIGGTLPHDRMSLYSVYEVDSVTCARRELDRDELPLAVMMGWDPDLRKTLRVRFCLPACLPVRDLDAPG